MKDRIPLYPGRVKLTPVSGQSDIYDMARADEPQQEGTPLNKNTLLTDETATALGLSTDASVNDALAKLSAAAFLDLTQLYTKVETASQLPVGASVPINVDGVAKDFIVIQQGKPSDVYDDSCSGTWLMMKELHVAMAADASDNDYQNSDIHAYLNNDFFNLLDSSVQSVVKTAKIPYWNGEGNGGSLATGANGLSAKVFLLSLIETGCSAGSYMPSDGAAIGYFTSSTERIAYNSEGTKSVWWTRSPYAASNTTGNSNIWVINSAGNYANQYCTTSTYYARPVIIVPDDTDVSGFGYYTDGEKVYTEQYSVGTIVDVFGGSVDLGGTKIETGSYTGAGASSGTLTFSFAPKVVFICDTTPATTTGGIVHVYAVCIYGMTLVPVRILASPTSQTALTCSWTENALQWSGTDLLNVTGYNYNYIAIG